MSTTRKFLIYLILVVLFFIFSQLMIAYALHTTYKTKNISVQSETIEQVELKASSIDGYVTGKVKNNEGNILENKFIKIETFSKHDVLMGTKYIKIDNIKANEEKEFEIHFNFNKVEKAVIEIVNEETVEQNEEINLKEMVSDPKMSLAAITAAVILVHFI